MPSVSLDCHDLIASMLTMGINHGTIGRVKFEAYDQKMAMITEWAPPFLAKPFDREKNK